MPAHLPVAPSSATQLTHGSQFVETTLLSRDGRWLYYDSDLSGNMDLYRMALPAGAPERLTSDSSDDFWPSPSPDGREVAFHSWRAGSRDIWVMGLDGAPLQRVTILPGPGGVGRLGARRESSRLGHLHRPGRHLDGTPDLARCPVGAAGRAARLGVLPPWSPDGRSLTVSASLTRGALWIMPADSGMPRLVADTTGPRAVLGNQEQWSDDGRAVYTLSNDSTGTTFWRIPLEGGTPERLMTFPAGGRVSGGWSAAAGRLAYAMSEGRSDVWVMEVRTR